MASKLHPPSPAPAVYFLYVLCFNLYVTTVAYLGFHFGGGVQNISGKVGVFAWREAPCSAWRSYTFGRGVRGHAPRENF